MTDHSGKSMSELIALHNELAVKLRVNPATEFKNLKAARAAVNDLENKMNQATNEGSTETTTTDAGAAAVEGVTKHVLKDADTQKYNSSGKRGPNQGVGAFAKELIVAGLSNADVLTKVMEKFPDAKTSKGCIAFYRTALSKAGKETGPTPEQLRKQAEELIAKAASVEAAQKAAAEALAADEAAKAASAQAFDAATV
jgi:hypothetical protein